MIVQPIGSGLVENLPNPQSCTVQSSLGDRLSCSDRAAPESHDNRRASTLTDDLPRRHEPCSSQCTRGNNADARRLPGLSSGYAHLPGNLIYLKFRRSRIPET